MGDEGTPMTLPLNAPAGDFVATPLLSSIVRVPPNQNGATCRTEIYAHSDCVQLRPGQRIPFIPAEKVVLLRDGMLAVDAMPAKGKLQILDFLVAGDVISASVVLPARGVSLRAITSTSLTFLDWSPDHVNQLTGNEWSVLLTQCRNQLARVNIYQMMIGRLETEPRVASFLLSLALRSAGVDEPEPTIALPMSRTDIANYLVINSDTLSRTMMKFSALGLIERASRHAVRILDLEGLRKRTPLAPLLSTVFQKAKTSEPDNGDASHIAARPEPPILPLAS
jgi:CRP-like cAMP-binding protein